MEVSDDMRMRRLMMGVSRSMNQIPAYTRFSIISSLFIVVLGVNMFHKLFLYEVGKYIVVGGTGCSVIPVMRSSRRLVWLSVAAWHTTSA